MIKAIIFDLDNTLFDTKKLVKRERLEACEAMIKVGLPAKSIKEAYNNLLKIIKKYGSNNPNHLDKLCSFYKIKPYPKIIASGIVAYHNVKIGEIHPIKDAIPTIIKLIKRGYKTGIVTRGIPIKQWEKIIRLGLIDLFDVILIQDERIVKTKEKILEQAIKKLKCNPKEAIYVGDNPYEDVLSANKKGIISIQYENGPYKRLSLIRPKYKIKNISELIEIINKMKKK